ncbi:MAG: glycosyltransferase, partial [Chitinophagaceae bacterium]
YFLRSCDAFVTMSEKVMNDLRSFEPTKPAKQVLHPLYDNFGEPVSKIGARTKLGLATDQKIVLFFGFIRKYKGLDLLFESVKLLQDKPMGKELKILVAGEFYENEEPYKEQIKTLNIADQLILRTQFIADPEVKYYLGAADVVIQPYRNATQSGVTPLAYHFEKPMIVTNVGSLPTLVPHEKVGLVCEPEPDAIANAMLRFFELGENYFIDHLRSEKKKYAWSNLTSALTEVAGLAKQNPIQR